MARSRSLARRAYMSAWALLFVGVIYWESGSIDKKIRRSTQSTSNKEDTTTNNVVATATAPAATTAAEEKPIIYTYFGANPDWEKGDFGGRAEQEHMLQAWVDVWRHAGWEPKVLYESDARSHPYFENYENVLNDLHIQYYDHICFHRWLAMVMAGGGWMADYDTYPIEMPPQTYGTLPNNGKFTAYDNNIEGGAIPSLLSGTKEEWSRITGKLIYYMAKHKGQFSSDMRALTEFNIHEPNSFIIQNNVQSGIPVTTDGKLDCTYLWRRHAIAVHFSHRGFNDALESGFFAEVENSKAQSRAYYGKQFRKRFNEECKPQHKGFKDDFPQSYKNKMETLKVMFPDTTDDSSAQ